MRNDKAKKIRVTIVSDELPKGCGLATYYDNLVSNLTEKDIDARYSGVRKLFGNYPFSLSRSVKTRIVHFTDQKVAAVLLFSPFRRYKAVVTVLDIIELINFKDVYHIRSLKARVVHKIWSWIIKQSFKKADALIAISDHTKKDVQGLIGKKKKIKIIYGGADKRFRHIDIRKVKHSVLFVGSALPHKNLATLLEAFSIVVKEIPDATLVIAGRNISKDYAIHKSIRRFGLERYIIFKGDVKDTPTEYSKADLLVFPSLYEGFGLPVLEAMACGCPVACSNRTSLPEVAGDAAAYFDGYDTTDMAKKIILVLTDDKLKEEMIKKGFVQAKKFSWKKYAKETAEVYRGIMEKD